MAFLEVNGAKLYYQITGDGPSVLQVPGAVSGAEGYALVTPAMAEHFTVIDYDPRGYGRSDRPEQEYNFEVWSSDMIGLLDQLGIEETHIHGGSMGSTLALNFAAEYPQRVRGLVLSGCTAKSDALSKSQFETWKALARAYGMGSRELAHCIVTHAVTRDFMDGPDGGEPFIEQIRELCERSVEVDVYCAACDYLIEVDVTGDLPNVTASTLILVGDEDPLTPAEQGPTGAGARYIYDHLTNAAFKEYVVLEGSSHNNLGEVPEACLAAIIPFLQRVDAEL